MLGQVITPTPRATRLISPDECWEAMSRRASTRVSRRARNGSSSAADPSTVFGASLKQWLRSDLGSVSSWTDKSGNGNHATQASAPLQPSIVAGVLNGRPIFRFASGNQMANPLSLTTPATVAIVMQYKDVATLCDVYSASNGFPSVQAAVNGALQWGLFATGTSPSGQNITASFKACFVVSRTTSDCDLVTSSTLANVSPGAPNAGTQSWIGKDSALGDVGAFDAAEIVAINRAITAGERASLLGYFQGLYGSV